MTDDAISAEPVGDPVQRCDLPKCRIPQPHRHTTDPVEHEFEEWWCPTDQQFVMCPGPCPDGTEHTERRTRTVTGYRVEMLGPSHIGGRRG